MTIFLTGIGGFLGSHLAAHWMSAGHEVRGASSSGSAPAGVARVVRFSLGESVDAREFEGVECVVHLAYDRAAGLETNELGTRMVHDAAHHAGVPRQIFVSSYSARPDAIAEYGRLKYRLETFFAERHCLIVRPGLVIGGGGLFLRNMRKILSTPVMPLLNGGRDLLPVIGVDDLVSAMTVLLPRAEGSYNLFNPELVTMRRLIEAVKHAAGKRGWYVPVRTDWAAWLLTHAARAGIRLPVDVDNLKALQQNQAPIHRSDLPDLLPAWLSFEESVARVVPGG